MIKFLTNRILMTCLVVVPARASCMSSALMFRGLRVAEQESVAGLVVSVSREKFEMKFS